MKPIFGRGPSLQFRLGLAVLFSVALIVADSRFDSFAKVRAYYLDTIVSPFFYAANVPSNLLTSTSQNLLSRTQLEKENRALTQELLLKNSEVLLLRQLQQENARLRELLASPLRQDEYKMVAQVLSADTDPYSDQLIINKGAADNLYIGQPVINERGVVGQIIATAQHTSRVLLVCDSSHALPIQVLRNDTRAIAVGNGCRDELLLEYLPLNADIVVGDELVTSGLGGQFSEGYPVATVTSVKEDRNRAQTIIHAKPAVNVDRLRYLLLVWDKDHRDRYPGKKEDEQNSRPPQQPQQQPSPTVINSSPVTGAVNSTQPQESLSQQGAKP